jgi:hypothetical protein
LATARPFSLWAAKPSGRITGIGGGSSPVINIYNQSQSRTETRPNASGGVDVFIRDAVQGVIANDAQTNGPISKMLTAKSQGFAGR